MKVTVWHGTVAESLDLLAAITHYCQCEYDQDRRKTITCAAHTALVEEQAFLDRLLFYRGLRKRLQGEEWKA